jgi:hypothetical protein
MAEQLQGVEFRVFRSLLREPDMNTVHGIYVHLTHGPVVAEPEMEVALAALAVRGYVSATESGEWEVSPQGHGVQRSLLGDNVRT